MLEVCCQLHFTDGTGTKVAHPVEPPRQDIPQTILLHQIRKLFSDMFVFNDLQQTVNSNVTN